MPDTVAADTYWVWTEKAEEQEPKRHRSGEKIWSHYAENAPAFMLDQGLIIDSSEFKKSGQADLFEFIEG